MTYDKGNDSALKIAAAGAVVVALLGAYVVAGSYNKLVRLDQDVQSQWAQVENVYQRRADLVPNLVATVKGAAEFEKGTLVAVTEARARVGRLPSNAPCDAAGLQNFQQAQDQLGGALARLLVVAERYPDVKATANFRDLQAQLEGTENRISVERMRFNEAAREFNTTRDTFPTTLFVRLFGGRFTEKTYFQAPPSAASAPVVRF